MKRCLPLVVVFAATVTSAPITVMFDTAALVNGPGAPTIIFDLFNGDAVSNNQVFVTNIVFGGGTPTGIAGKTAGALGDLGTGVTLSDVDFVTEFSQAWTTGSFLKFDLTFTNAYAGGTPDSFTVVLLDGNGNVIHTNDPLGTDTFLAAELNTRNIQTYSGVSIPAPTVTESPEPTSFVLICTGLCLGTVLGYLRTRQV